MPKVRLCPNCGKKMRRLYWRYTYSFHYPHEGKEQYHTHSEMKLWGFLCTCGLILCPLNDGTEMQFTNKDSQLREEITNLKKQAQEQQHYINQLLRIEQ